MTINPQTIKILKDIASDKDYYCQKITINNSQATYMMKTVVLPQRLSNLHFEKILQQVKVLTSLSIPYLVKYQGAFIDSNSNRLSIVYQDSQQFISIQERMQQIINKDYKPFHEDEILQIGKKLLQILKKLHQKSIVHANINSKSILIDENNNIKLCQVNPTKNKQKQLRCHLYSNQKYTALEVQTDGLFLEVGDIWSVGCILYQLATLQPYFQGKNLQVFTQQDFYDKKASHIPESFSIFFKDVLRKFLLFQSSKRLRAQQILQTESFYQKPIKLFSTSKISNKMSSLKKIGRIGAVSYVVPNEKKKAVHFQQVIHKTSIMNQKSLVELLDEDKKQQNSDQDQSHNKSRFYKENDHNSDSDEQQQIQYQIKVSAPANKRNSQNLTQSIKMKQIMQAKLLKNKTKTVKDKKFMSNSFMSYLDSYKKQKVQLFKKVDLLIQDEQQQHGAQAYQQQKNLILKQSCNQKFVQNRKIIKQQLKGPLSFKAKQNKKFSASAEGFVEWKKQNKQTQKTISSEYNKTMKK